MAQKLELIKCNTADEVLDKILEEKGISDLSDGDKAKLKEDLIKYNPSMFNSPNGEVHNEADFSKLDFPDNIDRYRTETAPTPEAEEDDESEDASENVSENGTDEPITEEDLKVNTGYDETEAQAMQAANDANKDTKLADIAAEWTNDEIKVRAISQIVGNQNVEGVWDQLNNEQQNYLVEMLKARLIQLGIEIPAQDANTSLKDYAIILQNKIKDKETKIKKGPDIERSFEQANEVLLDMAKDDAELTYKPQGDGSTVVEVELKDGKRITVVYKENGEMERVGISFDTESNHENDDGTTQDFAEVVYLENEARCDLDRKTSNNYEVRLASENYNWDKIKAITEKIIEKAKTKAEAEATSES